MVGLGATFEGLHGSVGAVASGDGEHCATFRSDEVMDGTSCGAKYRQAHAAKPLAGAIVRHPYNATTRCASPFVSFKLIPLRQVLAPNKGVRYATDPAH